jgi:hypothetical protein
VYSPNTGTGKKGSHSGVISTLEFSSCLTPLKVVLKKVKKNFEKVLTPLEGAL